MHETSLHSSLKEWYSLPGDRFEVTVDDYIIDIVRDKLLIEIQIRNFSLIKKKLWDLVKTHNIRLVHPIPNRRWIIRKTATGEIISRRRSPKKGKLIDLFDELVRLPRLITKNNFMIEILMIEEEEIRCDDGRGSWRRKGVSIVDRKLVDVISGTQLRTPTDFLRFLPKNLNDPFTNRHLANEAGVSIRKSRRISYCLKKMGVIKEVGKNGNELLFARAI